MSTRSRRRHGRTQQKIAAAVALLTCGAASAQVAQRPDAPAPFRITGGVSYGVGVRTSDPDTSLLMVNNARSVGLVSTNPAGRNQDDGNLNYREGHVFSNALNAFADFQLSQGPISALVRLQGWHDFELKDGGVPFGHAPNGYQPGAPLSDSGARARAKFSNALISTAFVRGNVNVADLPVTVTFGNQNIGWRGYGIAPGPMSVLDPVDLSARARAGSFQEMGTIPFPAIRSSAKLAGGLAVDGFYQLGFQASQLPLCGTFFSPVDVYGNDGCERLMNPAVGATRTDRELLAQGGTINFGAGSKPNNSGQFGLAARWNPKPETELALSYARFHSRASFVDFVKHQFTTGTASFAANDPRNPSASSVYPRGIQLLTLEGKHDLKPVTVYGSVGFSPNRPIGYPIGEIAGTFLTPANTVFRQYERNVPLGGTYSAWDRRNTSDWQFGANHQFRNALGAATLALQGEVNAKIVHDFPDFNQVRYGRPDVFGLGPVNGVCANPAVCTNDGYVTRSAWSYTLQAVATYPKVFGEITLRPRIALTHDVKGYSYEGSMKEARVRVGLGLDAVYDKTTFSLGIVRNAGKSDFDNTRDRDYITLSVASRF